MFFKWGYCFVFDFRFIAVKGVRESCSGGLWVDGGEFGEVSNVVFDMFFVHCFDICLLYIYIYIICVYVYIVCHCTLGCLQLCQKPLFRIRFASFGRHAQVDKTQERSHREPL